MMTELAVFKNWLLARLQCLLHCDDDDDDDSHQKKDDDDDDKNNSARWE